MCLIVLLTLCLIGCGDVVAPGTTVLVMGAGGGSTKHTSGVYHAWGRDKTYSLSTNLDSFTEKMKILCKDEINMDVDVKWIGSFKLDNKANIDVITKKVKATQIGGKNSKEYRLSLATFYMTAISPLVREISRTVISPYETDNIKDNRPEIKKEIKKRVIAKLTELNYPVDTSDVLLSNLDYPPEVTTQRKAIKNAELSDKKKAAEAVARIAEAKRNAEIAMEEGKALVVKTTAEAKANKILSASITPQILAMEQWNAFKEAARGTNNETFFIPYETIRPSDIITPASVKKIRTIKK